MGSPEMRTAIATFIATPPPSRLAPRAAPEPMLPETAFDTAAAAPTLTPTLQGSVLLVEDNPINQKVAQSLVKMLGLDCETVENGELAIQRMQRGELDLVLMDCQMPVKDGYTATREWRAIESEKGLPPLPIIAMTANAMAGDRMKCLDAGMDDYLSKPVDRRLLESCLQMWLQRSPRREGGGRRHAADPLPPMPLPPGAGATPFPAVSIPGFVEEFADSLAIAETTAPRIVSTTGRQPAMPSMPTPAAAAAPQPAAATSVAPATASAVPALAPVLDVEVIEELRAIMGDEYLGLIRMFFEDAPTHIAKLQAALAANDVAAMVAPAHTLKSSSANLGAMALSAVAKRIEQGARTASLEKPALAVLMLENEFKRAKAALEKLLG
jgi:CheY-like chemotaxis protein